MDGELKVPKKQKAESRKQKFKGRAGGEELIETEPYDAELFAALGREQPVQFGLDGSVRRGCSRPVSFALIWLTGSQGAKSVFLRLFFEVNLQAKRPRGEAAAAGELD